MKNTFFTHSLFLLLVTCTYQTHTMELVVTEEATQNTFTQTFTLQPKSNSGTPSPSTSLKNTPQNSPRSGSLSPKKEIIDSFYLLAGDKCCILGAEDKIYKSNFITEDKLDSFKNNFSGSLIQKGETLYLNATHQNNNALHRQLDDNAQFELPIMIDDKEIVKLKKILQKPYNITTIIAQDNIKNYYLIEITELIHALGIQVEQKKLSSVPQDQADEVFYEMVTDANNQLKKPLNPDEYKIVVDPNAQTSSMVQDFKDINDQLVKGTHPNQQKENTTTTTSTKSPEKDPNINPNKRRNTIISGGIVFMAIIALLYKYNQLPNITELLNNIKGRITYFNFPK